MCNCGHNCSCIEKVVQWKKLQKNNSPPQKWDISAQWSRDNMFKCNCLAVSVVCNSINTAEGHEQTTNSDADANINQYVVSFFC